MPTYLSEQTIDKFKLKESINLKNTKKFKINTIDVIPFELQHGDSECYGFIFHDKESLIFFATDFMLMNQDFSAFPFTEIYIETNYSESKIQNALNLAKESDLESIKMQRQINTHTSVENAVKYLKKMNLSKCNKIIGIHVSDQFGNINEIKSKIYSEFNIPTYCFNKKGELV